MTTILHLALALVKLAMVKIELCAKFIICSDLLVNSSRHLLVHLDTHQLIYYMLVNSLTIADNWKAKLPTVCLAVFKFGLCLCTDIDCIIDRLMMYGIRLDCFSLTLFIRNRPMLFNSHRASDITNPCSMVCLFVKLIKTDDNIVF